MFVDSNCINISWINASFNIYYLHLSSGIILFIFLSFFSIYREHCLLDKKLIFGMGHIEVSILALSVLALWPWASYLLPFQVLQFSLT